MKTLRPFLMLIALVLMVGFACSLGGGAAPAPTQPPAQPQKQPTEPPAAAEPTNPPATDVPEAAATTAPVVSEATETAAPAVAADYYREEFEGDISNYSYFEYHEAFMNVTEDKSIKPTTKDGTLVFDLQKKNKWVYVTYDAYTYDNVKIEISADNRAKNSNNVSLICRYSEEGWYEFNIANSGLYDIFAYDAVGSVKKGYNLIANGGSTAIKQGKDVNVYTAVCDGDSLSLYINGYEVKTVTDPKFKFREGKVGFGVSSFEVTPILVKVDYLDITQP